MESAAASRPDTGWIGFKQTFGSRAFYAGMIVLAATGAGLGAAVNGVVGTLIGAMVGAASVFIFAVQTTLIWVRRERTMPWHVVAAAVAVLTVMLLGDVTNLLLFMREEGVPARSFSWITRTTDQQELLNNAAQLAYFDATIDGVRESRWIVWTAIALDSILLVWAYGMVGMRVVTSRRQRIDGERFPNAEKFLRWATAVLIGALVIDWFENLAVGVLVEDSLAAVSEAAKAAAASGNPAPSGIEGGTIVSFFVRTSTLLWYMKWFALSLVATLLLAERFSTKNSSETREKPLAWFARNGDELVEAGRRIRPLLVTLLVLVGLLFQPLQVDDLMLSLGDNGRQLGYATFVTLWMGLTLWSWTRYLLRNQRPDELLRPGKFWPLGLALLAIGATLYIGIGWHAIVLFPGLTLATIGLGGLLIDEVAQPARVDLPGDAVVADSPSNRRWPARLRSRVLSEQYQWVSLGAVGLVIFGLGVVLAQIDYLYLGLIVIGFLVMVDAAVGVTRRAQRLRRVTKTRLLKLPGKSKAAPKDDPHTGNPRITEDPTDFLPAFVGAAAVLAVGASMLSAAAAEAALASGSSGALRVTLVGAGLVIASGFVLGFKRLQVFGAATSLEHALVSSRAMSEVSLLVSLFAALVLAGWVWAEPVGTSRNVGALALVLVLVTTIGAASGQLIRWIDRIAAPRIFRQFGIDRFPIFALVSLWLIVGQLFLERSNHDVPEPLDRLDVPVTPAGCEASTPPQPSIAEALDSWLHTNAIQVETGGDRTNYPFILLASSGGGIRAGWWSAAVMGELIPETGPACPNSRPKGFEGRQIFAASGISGGSLGLATHQAAVVGGLVQGEGDEVTTAWVDERLGVDHLSPPLAWFAYVEIPQSMLGFPTESDRAAIMEQSWQESWGDDEGVTRGLHETWQTYPQLPILALNGVSVDDGCRVLVTVLDLNSDVESCEASEIARIEGEVVPSGVLPQTYGLGSVMCEEHDMRLSTAALLSARFPLITPSGRIGTGWHIKDGGCVQTGEIEVVDGGYRDANGAETAIDLWREVQPLVSDYNNDPMNPVCLVPVFVQILDDFRLPAPPAEASYLAPLLGPAEAILAARGTLSHTGDRAIAAEAAFQGNRYEIQPKEVPPGAHPALGWSLSETTRNKMTAALTDDSAQSSGIEEFRTSMDALTGSVCR